MPEITELRHDLQGHDADVGVGAPNPDAKSRGERLRLALRDAGGNATVSGRAAIPKTTIDGYLRGGEMKLSNAVALAEATGVRLEWLATGAGPMREGAAPQPSVPPAPPARPRLFSLINADRLGAAYAAALQALAARGQQGAEPRRVMQITTLIYDSLTEAEEKSGFSDDAPQIDIQNDSQKPVDANPKGR